MADVPSEPPGKVLKGGLSGLKKLPPWAWVLVLGGGLLLTLYLRHQSNQKAAADAAAATDNPPTTDSSLTGDTTPTDSTAGYSDPTSGLGGFLSAGGSGFLPSPAGAGGRDTTVNPITNIHITTGGGPPGKPPVHSKNWHHKHDPALHQKVRKPKKPLVINK